MLTLFRVHFGNETSIDFLNSQTGMRVMRLNNLKLPTYSFISISLLICTSYQQMIYIGKNTSDRL